MNSNFVDKIAILERMLSQFYSCKFLTEKKEDFINFPSLSVDLQSLIHDNVGYISVWSETHKSNKDLVAGFIPSNRKLHFGPTFRVSRSGRNGFNFEYLYIHNKIYITHNGIIFINKPNILVSKGYASATYEIDNTPDVIPHDYQNENGYYDLKNKFPNISENMLDCIYYFCINPLKKGVQIELDVECIDYSIFILERLKDNISVC